jgi:hypothetical protein
MGRDCCDDSGGSECSTFLGGSMAMASFCGMEICTGLAESCLEDESLLRDRRNCWRA